MERTTAGILRWSWWRRWHQAQAQAAHYRRRVATHSPAASSSDTIVPEHQGQQQGQGTIARVWERLVVLLPATKRVGRPFEHERRTMFDAIVHVLQTDCGWRNLPEHYPPWQTVHWQYTQWRKQGIWDAIWAGHTLTRLSEQLQL